METKVCPEQKSIVKITQRNMLSCLIHYVEIVPKQTDRLFLKTVVPAAYRFKTGRGVGSKQTGEERPSFKVG